MHRLGSRTRHPSPDHRRSKVGFWTKAKTKISIEILVYTLHFLLASPGEKLKYRRRELGGGGHFFFTNPDLVYPGAEINKSMVPEAEKVGGGQIIGHDPVENLRRLYYGTTSVLPRLKSKDLQVQSCQQHQKLPHPFVTTTLPPTALNRLSQNDFLTFSAF